MNNETKKLITGVCLLLIPWAILNVINNFILVGGSYYYVFGVASGLVILREIKVKTNEY